MANENIGTVFFDMTLKDTKFKDALKGVERDALSSAKRIEGSFSPMLDSLTSKMKQLAFVALGLFSVHKITEFIKESTLLATRIETLNISLHQIGKNVGYTTQEIDKYVAGVKKKGITTIEATQSVIKLAQANIDLAYAEKLARVAQDAAVVGNINSSEAFARMIHGIRTQQTEVLRGIGINVRMDQAFEKYAMTLNKTSNSLTQMERAQAITNAVLEEGAKLTGIYEAAMTTAGKQMSSTVRYVDEIKESIGKAFSPALTVLVMGFNDALKDLGKWLELPGSKEKIYEVAMAVKDFASVSWSAITSVIGIVGKFVSLLDDLKNAVKGAAFAISAYLVASLIMSVIKFDAATLAAGGFLAKLIAFGASPVGLAIIAIGAITAGLLSMRDELNKAENAINSLKERSKSFTMEEAQASAEKFANAIKTLNAELAIREAEGKPTVGIDVRTGELKAQIKLNQELLAIVQSRIDKTKELNEAEKAAAEVIKAQLAADRKKEEDLRNKHDLDRQAASVELNIAKSDSAAMLNVMKMQQSMEIELLKNAGVDKSEIAEKGRLQAIEFAEKEYDETIRLAKKKSADLKKERQGKFDVTKFLEEKENAAKNKRDQSFLQANMKILTDSLNEESGVRKAHFDFQLQQATEFSQMYSDILAKGRALDIERMKVQGYSEGRISQAARDAAIENAKRDRDESIRLAKESDEYKKTLGVERVERERILNAAISNAYSKFLADKRNAEQSFEIEGLQRKARAIADYKGMMIDLASFDKNEWDNRRENTDRWAIEQRDIIYRVFGSWKDASYELGKLDAAIAEQKKNIRISELKEQEDYFNQVGGFSKQAYDLRIERINLEADEVSKATGNDTLRMRYLEDQTKIAFRNAALAGDSFFNGVKAGFTQLSNEKETWGKLGDAMGGIFKDSLSRNLGNSIYDIFTGKTTDIGMIGQKIADDMLRGFSQKLGGMAADWLTKEYFDPWTASIGKVFSGVWDLAKTGYKAVVDYVASTEWGKAFGGMIKTFTSYLGDMLDAAIRFVKEVLVEWGILSAAKPVAGALSGITGGGINPLGAVGTATSLYGTGASLYGSITGGTSAISAGIEGMSSMAPSAYYGTLTGTVGGAPTLGGGASFLSGTSTTGTSALSSVGAAAAPFAAAAALGSLVQAFPDVFGIGGGDVQYSPGAAYTPEGLAANWAMYSMGGGHLGALNQIGTFKAMGWQPPEEVATMYTQRIMDAIPSVAALIFDGNMWRLSGKFAFPESSAADRFLSQFINDPGWDYQKGLYYGSQPAPWGEYAAGGYSDRAAIFGEKGGEWAVPAYSPEKEDFLESTGVADKIRQVLLETKGESNESPTNIQIFFDGYEVLSAMVDAADKNPRLHAKLRG